MSPRVFPELVYGRRDGFEQGRWTVESGEARRGGASCNLSERCLRVPQDDDAVARVVRAHELMHIRVSPHRREHVPDEGLPERALECAEEFRVNRLLSLLGFDTGLLCDGSEKLGARRLAESAEQILSAWSGGPTCWWPTCGPRLWPGSASMPRRFGRAGRR